MKLISLLVLLSSLHFFALLAYEERGTEPISSPPKFHSIGQDKQEPLVPTPLMSDETKWLLGALEKAHFKKLAVHQLDRKIFLENYMNNLDKQKLFFTSSDLNQFIDRYEPTLLTYLKQGNLFPAFEIYENYRQKALARLEQTLKFLNDAPQLDANNSFLVDRSEVSWAQSSDELNTVWNFLVTHEYINEIFSQIDENETSDETLRLLEEREVATLDKIRKKYERWHKNILEFEATDVQELYLTTLTQMFDPHTSFLNIKEKEKFDQAMHNEFVGIGAVLTDSDGYCTIKELLPGGPAEASREIEPEDIILQVAQGEGEFEDVVDMKLSKIVELIKGPKDTLVTLKIRPFANPSTTKIVKIIRDKIKLTANLASASLHKVSRNGENLLLGVVELPSFYGSSGDGHKATDDVEELVNVLKEESIQGLILDLRRNGGGYLSEAVNLAGLFISRGPVVQVKSSDGKVRKKFDFNPKLIWDGPLIVLVSRYSASASEIVAGALKNHRRAIIVGDTSTHGKGTVQSLLPMNLPFSFGSDGSKRSAAKITIQKYYLPSGESTQLTGVTSDIVMHSINQYLPIGESDLEKALDWDKIPEVNFRRPEGEFKFTESTIELLRTSSKNRQKSAKEFDYLEKNIAWFKHKRDQKLVSLNFKNRLNEKLKDFNKTQSLTEEFESLSTISYPSRNLVLQVVTEQKEKSLALRGLSGEEGNQTSTNFSIPESLDIRLHESLRILSDWVNEISLSQNAHAHSSGNKNI
ncbi:MAG: carboxy terminal-processing peptidase [Opitutae bacterium]